MTTEKDLVNAVKESLENCGELGRIKAAMRTEVIKLLNNSNKGTEKKNPKLTSNIIIINELIREYLDWMGYKYTSTVFITECDLSKHPHNRTLLARSLGVKDTEESKDLPLLCGLVETFESLKTT